MTPSPPLLREPTNKFLVRQPDRRIPRVLASVLLLALVLLLVLLAIGWPRLRATSIHYHLHRLRAEVSQLEEHEHHLVVELEQERAPARLAERAAVLGLEPQVVVEAPASFPTLEPVP